MKVEPPRLPVHIGSQKLDRSKCTRLRINLFLRVFSRETTGLFPEQAVKASQHILSTLQQQSAQAGTSALVRDFASSQIAKVESSSTLALVPGAQPREVQQIDTTALVP